MALLTPQAEAIWTALDRCNPAQRETVAEALIVVTDQLCREGLYSPSLWTLLGIRGAEPPIPEETKRLAARRIREARAG